MQRVPWLPIVASVLVLATALIVLRDDDPGDVVDLQLDAPRQVSASPMTLVGASDRADEHTPTPLTVAASHAQDDMPEPATPLVAPDPAPTGTLAGRVVDEHGSPVPLATVMGWDSSRVGTPMQRPQPDVRARTDADGRFELGSVPVDFVVSAWAAGYAECFGASGHVPPDERLDDVELVVTHAVTIEGRVVDESARPLPQTIVAISHHRTLDRSILGGRDLRTGPPRLATTTEDDGRFRIADVADVEYHVSAEHRSYEHVEVVHSASQGPLEIVLPVGITLEGRVLGPDGLGVSEAIVRAYQPDSGLRQAITSPSGAFTLGGLGADEVHLLVSADECALQGLEPFDVPRPGLLEIRMRPEQALGGYVVDADGEGLADIEIEVEGTGLVRDVDTSPARTWERLARRNTTRTTSTGRFELRQMYAGEFRVTARDPARPAEPRSLTTPSGVDDLRIILDGGPAPSAHVSGTVVDALSHAPLDTFNVSLMRPQPGGGAVGKPHLFDGAAGRFSIDAVEPGTLYVSVRSPGYLPLSLPPLAVAAGDALDVGEAALARMTEATLRVVDDAGRPLADVDVRVVDPDALPSAAKAVEAQVARDFTDDDGRVAFAILPAKRLRVDLLADGAPLSATHAEVLDLTVPLLGERLIVLSDASRAANWRRLEVVVLAGEGAQGIDPLDPMSSRELLRELRESGALAPPDTPVLLSLRGDEGTTHLARLWSSGGVDAWHVDGDAEQPSASQPVLRFFTSHAAHELTVIADGYATRTIAIPATPTATDGGNTTDAGENGAALVQPVLVVLTRP